MKDYIELCNVLTIKGITPTGGQAKLLIRSEQVKVNGEIETRNKKKLRENDVVEVNNKTFRIKKDLQIEEIIPKR